MADERTDWEKGMTRSFETLEYYKDLRIYTKRKDERVDLLIYRGRSKHPIVNGYAEDMDMIEKRIKLEKEFSDRRIENANERKSFKHTLKEGDILSCSWGYDQTNVDFYQVTKVVSGKTVKIRQIAKKSVDVKFGEYREVTSDYVEPVKGSFLERAEEMTKRVSKGNCISISSFEFASPWSGKPMYETATGFGH